MLSLLLNVFLFLLGLGIGIKYERWIREKAAGNHSRFSETGFSDSRYHKTSGFQHSTSARPRPGGDRKSSNTSRFNTR